jgi:hypothetical protein
VFKLLVHGWQRRGSAKSDRKGSKPTRKFRIDVTATEWEAPQVRRVMARIK